MHVNSEQNLLNLVITVITVPMQMTLPQQQRMPRHLRLHMGLSQAPRKPINTKR